MPEVQKDPQGPIFRLWHLHGTAALVHDDAYHMAVPITWQCGGRPCHQHGRQSKFKRMARFAKSSRCGTAPGFSQKLATGLQSLVPALRDLQPYVLRVRVGEARFFEIGRGLS